MSARVERNEKRTKQKKRWGKNAHVKIYDFGYAKIN